jgi:chromosomal replication initiation ATPase DnaA
MTHYQELHILKQEVKRQRLMIIEQKNNYERIIQGLRREILKPKIDINKNNAKWEDAMRCVCQVYDITPDDIYSHIRKQHILYGRHTFNYICRKTIGMSLDSIGRIINRDHSTIIHSVRQTQDLIEYDRNFAKTYQQTLELLDSYRDEESIVINSHLERRERCVAYEEEI